MERFQTWGSQRNEQALKWFQRGLVVVRLLPVRLYYFEEGKQMPMVLYSYVLAMFESIFGIKYNNVPSCSFL